MKLTLYRYPSKNGATIGELYVGDEFECYSMEDETRDEKIPGVTAIPAGEYDLIVNYSPRFKKKLPLIVDVPNFTGVRIHPGNRAEDTEGCVLVGTSAMAGASARTNYVVNSRAAFNLLFDKIKAAIAEGEDVTIEFVEGMRV